MDTTARKALEKLLRSVENATGKEQASGEKLGLARPIQLRFTKASFPDYLGMPTNAEKTSCNATLKLAERDGAITIQWDSRAGSFEHVQLIRLIDGNALAKVLGAVPRWDATSAAQAAFAPYLPTYPVLQSVLETWRRGATVRSTRPDSDAIQEWMDAVRVVNACLDVPTGNRKDVPIRRLSAELFSDSKRIASLAPLIDVLTQGKITGLPRDEEEFFQEMGLVKFPQTLLMAASQCERNRVIVQLIDASLSVAAPYLGFYPPAIAALDLPGAPMTLLTIENLTTFHETAEHLRQASESSGPILVMYTGGMPSPSWRRVYRIALACLPEGSSVWHWGDVDAGGFRIADKLAQDCDQCRRTLLLHLMSVTPKTSRKDLSDAEVAAIAAICVRRNWLSELQSIEDHRSAIEQESLPVALPAV